MKLKLLSFFVIFFIVNSAFACDTPHHVYHRWDPYHLADILFVHTYKTKDAALAAFHAGKAASTRSTGFDFEDECNSTTPHTGWIGFLVRYNVNWYNYNYRYTDAHIYAWNPDYIPPDSDGDGVPDDYDFTPSSPQNLQYKKFSEIKNAAGETVYIQYILSDGSLVSFGEKPADMAGYQTYLSITSQYKDNSSLESDLNNLGFDRYSKNSPDQSSSDIYDTIEAGAETIINDNPGVSDQDFEAGQTVQDSSLTDTTTLQTIQDNTANTTTNLQNLSKYLADINKNIQVGNALKAQQNLQSSGGSGDSGGSALSQDDVKNSITDALNSNVDVPSNSSISDAEIEAQSSINPDASLANDAPDAYKTKTDITSKMVDFINNNPISGIISGSHIECDGAVDHVNANVYGHTISLSLGGFESQLQVFGQMLLAITTLAGMLLIFRR